jgi:hypothetical protein
LLQKLQKLNRFHENPIWPKSLWTRLFPLKTMDKISSQYFFLTRMDKILKKQ